MYHIRVNFPQVTLKDHKIYPLFRDRIYGPLSPTKLEFILINFLEYDATDDFLV